MTSEDGDQDTDGLEVGLAEVRATSDSVYRTAFVTPCLHSFALSQRFGAEVFLKAECLQRTGSFKVRGAAARMARLSEAARRRGVVAASAGNHAQGLAVAAAAAGVSAVVVMPRNAALAKVQATRSYGAKVVLEGDDFGQATARAEEIARRESRILVPAFDDRDIIAGQGTVGIEIVEQCPGVELVIVPVGGGGLIAGTAVALKALLPGIEVVGVQSEAAPAVARSFAEGHIERALPSPTIADGVAVPEPGSLTFPLIERLVDEVVTVEEEMVAEAIVLLLERSKLVVEGAGALGVAALLSGAVMPRGRRTCIVLSGGNIDINVLATVVQHGLLSAARYMTLTVGLDDHPGTLAALLKLIADCGANVLEVNHIRQGIHLPVRGVAVRLLLETRDAAHIEEIASALKAAGYTETIVEQASRAYRPAAWDEP